MDTVIKNRFELTDREIRNVVKLKSIIWPPKQHSYTMDELIASYKKTPGQFDKVITLYEKDVLTGHAEVFDRDIEADSRAIRNMALAGVCVLPAYRNRKLGSHLVSEAFSFIESQKFECSVFQTPVPQFYEKLGCRIIHNRFINSKHDRDPQKNPWWDTYIMVYPADASLGDGVIDLKGNGY